MFSNHRGNFQTTHRGMSKLNVTLILLAMTLMINSQVSANVIGFDFGSTFFKITLVKPGQPFAIVENTATKRKTETWLTITNEERLFGVDSFTESTKYPVTSYSQLHRFLGQEWDEAFVEKMKKERLIVNEFAKDDRGLIGWKVYKKSEDGGQEEIILYTEELMAQLLKYGRKLSEIQAGGTIKDCVITIPSWYTPSQRRMVLDAADIAGLSVLQLIHENTAAATMFGIDRLDTAKPVVVLFYNMGGMDTEVSIVRYSAITEVSTNKSYEHIEVLSETYDQQLGGQDFDLVLVKMLAERFNNMKERQGKADVRQDSRIVKRLLKEAVKIKDVLSANKMMQVKVPDLADYVTLNTMLQRSEFEEQSQHLFDRVVAPVHEALTKAGLTIQDIDQIELIGGGIRVPRIQELLQQTLQKNELGVHLNGDEAMCFGSAFIASNSSASFKVRKVYLTVHPQTNITIQITPVDESKKQSNSNQQGNEDEFENPDNQAQENFTTQTIQYEKTYVLYKKTDFLGQKKSLSLTYDTDMRINVFAENGDQKEKLVTYTVKGIDQAASSDVAKQEGSSQPKVTLSFEFSRSGLIQLNKAEAKIEETYTVEERVPAKASKSRILNSTKDNSTESADVTNETADANTTTSDDTEPKTVKKTKKRTVPFPLTNIERQYYGLPTLTQEQMKACRERLRAYEKRDEDKAKTDKAKNDFESVIYALRDWVNEDDNMPFVGNADKQEEIIHNLREAEDWLEGEGYNAKYGEYISKFQDLNGKFNKLKVRKEEYSLRDPAVEEAKRKISNYQDKCDDISTKKPWITDDNKKDLYERLNETVAWLDEQVAKQKGVALDEDPVFRVGEIEVKMRRIESLWTKLNAIPKPKEASTEKKKKKLPKNIKIDNMTFEGNEGINIEDLINFQGGDHEGEDDTTQGENINQQDEQNKPNQDQAGQSGEEKPYDASEEDL